MTETMKSLHVIASLDPKMGGPVEGLKQLAKALEARGVEIEIVCCDPPDAPWLTEFDFIRIHALGPARFGYHYTSKLVPWLKAKAKNYNAVIVEGLWQYHSFAVWRALRGTQTPYFVFTHGMLDPWFKKAYPLKHLKKWLYWPWAEYRTMRDAEAVLFTCEEERLLARDSFWLYKARESVVSYGTGLPPQNAEELTAIFYKTYPALRGKRIFLFLSRIHPKKGCDLLLNAFAERAQENKDLHLVMAGPDQTGWGAKLREQAKKLGIAERITWTGILQGDRKWGAFYASEVFCLPSHQENFGIVVAEALACGKPVLISNRVNIWREIETDSVGLIEADTEAGTRRLLQRWLETSEEDKRKMRENTKKCFLARFHIDSVADNLVRVINQASIQD